MIGLPIATQRFIYSLIYGRKECTELGGGITLYGNLRGLYKMMPESGAQAKRERDGFADSESASCHEGAHSNTLGR